VKLLTIELLITLNIQESRLNNLIEQNNMYNVHVILTSRS